jgi:hypothetical protein
VLGASAALAGPVADFNAAFGGMYARYRAALFATNAGDPEKAGKAVAAFATAWSDTMAPYADAPPPQFADDPMWGDTLAAVGGEVKAAEAAVAGGDLPGAHETLEAVRGEIGALHDRNGIETFSDRMNAYHAAMEAVLESDPAMVQSMLEQAAVLAYLADDVLKAPPPGAATNDEYVSLAEEFRASVEGFRAAARSGSPQEIKAAASRLKVPYSKLFLKFG